MAQLLVRNLDDPVIDELKASAVRHHRSLEAEVRSILAEAASQARMHEHRRHAADIRTGFAGKRFTDSAELIREDRER